MEFAAQGKNESFDETFPKSFREKARLMTLAEVAFAAENAKIPLRIDRPGFTRIAVDLQEQIRRPLRVVSREIRLGISNISY
ncbi:hypothetical protein HY989_06240 [Candidatus Micrarchaeota archaeon]|nr:hypothetical protein [Candidatus Micrarchaeota archaeon]